MNFSSVFPLQSRPGGLRQRREHTRAQDWPTVLRTAAAVRSSDLANSRRCSGVRLIHLGGFEGLLMSNLPA